MYAPHTAYIPNYSLLLCYLNMPTRSQTICAVFVVRRVTLDISLLKVVGRPIIGPRWLTAKMRKIEDIHNDI